VFRFLLNSLLILAAVGGAAFVAPSAHAAEYFTINSFDADINIHEDGSFVVTETIALTFHRQRHGIYREIPYKYTNELGDVVRMPIKVLAVKKADGRDWDYKVSRSGSVVNIRIGHPDIYVYGPQTYVITYRVKNGLLFFEKHDELYWNVTGNYWEAPIESASATVNVITGRNLGRKLTGCYSGYYGRADSDCNVELFDKGARFTTTRSLRAGEGLTIAFGFDTGIVSPPSAMARLVSKYNLVENWVFVIPIIALIFMVYHWRRKGRDPRVRQAVTVMYEPPQHNQKPLSPAEVGSLVDEKMDSRDLTAAIVGLGVKGYLRIEEVKKEGFISLLDTIDYDLKKLKQPDSELTPFERDLMSDLFKGHGDVVSVSDLKNKFYKNLSSLRSTLWSQLKAKKYFSTSPPSVRAAYVGVGVVIAVFGSLAAVWLAPDYVAKGVAAAVLSGLIVIAFSSAMPVKTRAGALVHMHILGFQEFMNRADRDRLERMGKDIFYKYMPYAIALDVVDHWAAAFEGIYGEPPSWYVSTAGFRTFSPVAFSRSLGHATSSLSAATFSAPRGSGTGGGGGFSGGGGGGGGGGSW